MSAVDTNFYKEKKKSIFYFSLWFLFVSILVTILLYVYVSKIHDEILTMDTNIEQLDTSISELNSKPEIQIYNIYDRNKGILEKLAFESRITSFVSHFKKNFTKYNVLGEWFSYSNWEVSVAMSAKTNDGGYAYEKVVEFITWYNADEKAQFTLDTIGAFKWYDEIEFSWKFILKPENILIK